MEIKNIFYQTGKILYKIVEVPFNVFVGNYDSKNRELLKQNKELKNKIKSLDFIKDEQSLEIKRLDQIENNLNYTNQRLN